MGGRAAYEGPSGQDPAELFRLCVAPTEADRTRGFTDDVKLLPESKARALVHRDGDWHRSVHLWLYHAQSRSVVLQKRSENKDTHPGLWDISSAGHITGDDDVRTTVIREAEEELGLTGLQGADVRFLFTAVTQAEGETAAHGHFRDNEFAHVFVAPAPELGALSLGATEVSAVALVRIADMREALAVPPPAPPAAGAGVTWRPASGGLSDGCGCGCQGSGSVAGVGPLVPRAPSYVARLEALLPDVRSEPPSAAP